MKLFKFGCKHNWVWKQNIYGDEINYLNGKRSIWKCTKCGKIQYRDKLEPVGTLFVEMLNRKYDEYNKNKFDNWKKEKEKTINCIKSEMIQAAELGKCWLDIRLVIDEEKNDRYYWEKLFDELGIKFNRNSLPSDKEILVYNIDYTLRWKN